MALNKLRRLDSNTVGVTLPKDDLRLDGYVDEDGQLDEEYHLHINRTGPGEWNVEIVENL